MRAKGGGFHAKDVVLGIVVKGKARAYLGSVLTQAGGHAIDDFQGVHVEIDYDSGTATFSFDLTQNGLHRRRRSPCNRISTRTTRTRCHHLLLLRSHLRLLRSEQLLERCPSLTGVIEDLDQGHTGGRIHLPESCPESFDQHLLGHVLVDAFLHQLFLIDPVEVLPQGLDVKDTCL